MYSIRLLALLFILIQLSCQNNQNQVRKEAPQYLTENPIETPKSYTIIEKKNIWDSLSTKKGCLSGGQWVANKKWGGEGCVLTIDKAWNSFLFEQNKGELAHFLINQLPDKTTTQIHTCPDKNATKGELALYCLQGISKVNFDEFSELKWKKDVCNQKEIWEMQKSDEQIKKLQKVWLQHFGFIKM